MKEQFLKTLEISRTYTLEVAEKMPEDLYGFKPTDSVWDFGELTGHIAYGIKWWESNFILNIPTEWDPPGTNLTKSAIITEIDEAYSSLKNVITGITNPGDIIAGFYATLDHITHHRGQAVIYLRCNSITPPEYKF